MRNAGLASRFPERYDSALCKRLTGLDFEGDEPWWATQILTWLAMYATIMDCPMKAGWTYRIVVEQQMKACAGGQWLYGVYRQFVHRCNQEARERQSRTT